VLMVNLIVAMANVFMRAGHATAMLTVGILAQMKQTVAVHHVKTKV